MDVIRDVDVLKVMNLLMVYPPSLMSEKSADADADVDADDLLYL